MKKRGFTLIELLVVISIIALLVSILMPALSKARYSAKLTVCKSNQRQLLMGLNLFASEHDDKLPVSPSMVSDSGYHRPYELSWNGNNWGVRTTPIATAAGTTLGTYLPEVGVFNCTLAPIDKNSEWPPQGSKFAPAIDPDTGATLKYGESYKKANYTLLHSSYTLLWNYQGYNFEKSAAVNQNLKFTNKNKGEDFVAPTSTASKDKLAVQDSLFWLPEGYSNFVWDYYGYISSHPFKGAAKKAPYFVRDGALPSNSAQITDVEVAERPDAQLNAGYIDGSVRQFSSDPENMYKHQNYGAFGFITREHK
ncbi:MAG: type II secretion system protein [Phycisphaerae bacterium]|nr:type II secretion system protein [Phycisphaerae bacterium]